MSTPRRFFQTPSASQQSSGLDPNILRKCAKALDEALPTVPMDWKDYFQRNWLLFRGSKAAKFFSKHWSVDDTESTLIHFEYRSRMGPKASLMAGKTRALSEHGLMVSPKIHQLESHGQWKGNSYPNHHGNSRTPSPRPLGRRRRYQKGPPGNLHRSFWWIGGQTTAGKSQMSQNLTNEKHEQKLWGDHWTVMNNLQNEL